MVRYSSMAQMLVMLGQRILQLLRASNSLVTGSALLLTGTVCAQGISFLAIPALGRLYQPAAFGEAAFSLTLIAVLSVVACGRYDQAIMLPDSDREAQGVMLAAALYCALLSLFLAIGCFIAGWVQPHLFVTYHLWAVPLGVCANGLLLALSNWLLRQRAFGMIALSRGLSSIVLVGLQIGLSLLLGGTALSLIIGYLGSVLCGTAIVLVGSSGQAWSRPLRDFVASTRWATRRYRSFPLVEAWGSLLNSSGSQLPVFILTGAFSAAAVGSYSMAYRLISMPVVLVASSLGQVFFQHITLLYRTQVSVFQATRSLVLRLMLAGSGPFILLALFGEDLITLLLGDRWSEAGTLLQYLSLGLFFQLLFSPVSAIFLLLEAQKRALLVHGLVFVVPIVALEAGLRIFGPALAPTIKLLSVALAALYGLLTLWCLFLAHEADHRARGVANA